jgi:hypothetical protein
MNYTISLLHGSLICIPFTLFVILSFTWTPRLWLHSLPEDIQQMVPPKSRQEVQWTRYVLLPLFVLILPGLSIASAIYLSEIEKLNMSFSMLLMHLYLIWMTVHLWDLLIIDGLYLLFMNPGRPPIPGTENAKGWKDYGFHVKAFMKASIFSALFVVPVAAILSKVL